MKSIYFLYHEQIKGHCLVVVLIRTIWNLDIFRSGPNVSIFNFSLAYKFIIFYDIQSFYLPTNYIVSYFLFYFTFFYCYCYLFLFTFTSFLKYEEKKNQNMTNIKQEFFCFTKYIVTLLLMKIVIILLPRREREKNKEKRDTNERKNPRHINRYQVLKLKLKQNK